MTAAEESYVEDTSSLLEGIKILLVEDDEDSRELLIEILQGAGAVVEAAATAASGFSAFQSFHPQVLISDIGLPDEDGMSLARRIRALEAPQGSRTPLIALTAYTAPRERTRVLEAGFNLHIGKPYDLNELLHSVRSVAPV
jgi:DNA-binding response OmpR family regulator